MNGKLIAGLCCAFGLAFAPLTFGATPETPAIEREVATSSAYIVRGHSVNDIAREVRALGGEVTHELAIINAVAARLTSSQLRSLRQSDAVAQISGDGQMTTAGGIAGG
jgi:hypothetical protein